MNSVHLIGRVGNIPTIKYIGASNRALCDFVLAVEQRNAPPDPDTGHRPCYFFVIKVWGTKAEAVHGRIEKGQRVALQGHLVQENFTPVGASEPIRRAVVEAEFITPLDKARSSSAA